MKQLKKHEKFIKLGWKLNEERQYNSETKKGSVNSCQPHHYVRQQIVIKYIDPVLLPLLGKKFDLTNRNNTYLPGIAEESLQSSPEKIGSLADLLKSANLLLDKCT